MEENNRLTDLTRMLLSSPAFSGFLNELSANGGSVPSALQKTTAPQQAPSQPQSIRKDVNPHQVARQLQSQHQVGMVMVPEPQVDLSVMDLNTRSNWSSGVDMNSFQVFSVTEMPEDPAIDVCVLSGKSSSPIESMASSSKEIPTLPSIQASSKEQMGELDINPDIELDGSLSLFDVSSSVKSAPSPSSPQPHAILSISKPQQFELIAIAPYDPATTAARLEKMCAELDESCARLENITSHLC